MQSELLMTVYQFDNCWNGAVFVSVSASSDGYECVVRAGSSLGSRGCRRQHMTVAWVVQ